MSINPSKKSCEILIAMARAEKQLEIMRQALCEIGNFEPYAAFKHLDQQKKNYLQTADFMNFFAENRVNFDENAVENVLIKHYDYDHDGKLCYAEFLRILLPNDEPGLRTLVTQRPTYIGTLPEDIEEALFKLLQTELQSVIDLETSKRELLDNNSSIISQLFRDIDVNSTGYINFANLFDFFKKNGIYPYEEEIIAIIRKLDKDDDGRLVIEELEEGLGSISSPIRDLYTQPKKSEAKYEGLYQSKYEGKYEPKYEGKYEPKYEPTNEEQEKKSKIKDYSGKKDSSYGKNGNESQNVYRNNTFNPSPNPNSNSNSKPNPIQNTSYTTTSLKKSYKYENQYQPNKNVYDEALTEKNAKYEPEDTKQDKAIRNYKNAEPSSNSYYQKESNVQSSSYIKKPIPNFDKEEENNKEIASKYVPNKDYRNQTKSSSNVKADYSIPNTTKSPPHTFYYPYEPIRKAFSPMKDKILKSSRFEEDPYERKTRGYPSNNQNPQRTRTPIGRPETWKIEDKLKRIDDNYAKNSRYNGNKAEENQPRNSKEDNINLIRSAPKQVLYRDYTPDPNQKRGLYKTMELTPDKMFDTQYMQSSQYRRDKEVVEKIMGPSDHNTSSYKADNYKMRTPIKSTGVPNEIRDLAGYLSSVINFEGELERMKQDLALRPDFNLVDLFVFFDADQKGHCNLEEFQETLRKLELFVQEKEALLFIKRFDRGSSGMIKFADFTCAFTPILSDYLDLLNQRKPINTDLQFSYKELFSQETIRLISNIFRAHFTNEIAIEGLRKALSRKDQLDFRKIFECVDLDRDNYISEDELESFVSSQGFGMNLNKNDVHLLLERIDNDKDGKISFDEFCFELDPKLEELE